MAAYLASLLVQVWDKLVLGPVHRALLSPHGDEGDASFRVVGVNELAEGLAPLIVLTPKRRYTRNTRNTRNRQQRDKRDGTRVSDHIE